MKRIAIIDMGTNTFHLLLAEIGSGTYRIFYRTYEAVKIGMAGINEGIISDAASQRAITAMIKFRQFIDQHDISEIYALATSAFRNAANGPALADEIRSITNISIRIISGDEEADLIFAGIKAAFDLGNETSLVMDIGAGSVEFILGNGQQVFWKKSFEIGGQRLLEKFQKQDPISPEEIAALDTYFHKTLGTLLIALRKYQPNVLVGSSGTFDTLSEIFCIRENIPYDAHAPETPLSLRAFYDIYHEFILKNREERMRIPGMIALRVDMIVVACCLVRFVLEENHFNSIRVSTFSLKEGMLATLSQQTNDRRSR